MTSESAKDAQVVPDPLTSPPSTARQDPRLAQPQLV